MESELSSKNVSNDGQTNNMVTYLSWGLRSSSKFIANQRYMAYTSEVGESLRPVTSRYLVNGTYALSLLYVGADIYTKTHDMYKTTGDKKQTFLKASDLIIWHSFASMIFPAVTIHTIVKQSDKAIKKTNIFDKMPRIKGWAPTVIGLLSIPVIIHPLDHLTDWLMDRSVRKIIKNI